MQHIVRGHLSDICELSGVYDIVPSRARNMRYMKPFEDLKRVIRSGVIGEEKYIDFQWLLDRVAPSINGCYSLAIGDMAAAFVKEGRPVGIDELLD